jgi:hypothetical protein
MVTQPRLPWSTGTKSLPKYPAQLPPTGSATKLLITKIAGKLFVLDPNGTVVAFADTMRRKILIAAILMMHETLAPF